MTDELNNVRKSSLYWTETRILSISKDKCVHNSGSEIYTKWDVYYMCGYEKHRRGYSLVAEN